MAIVKMKGLTLLTPLADRDRLLERLQHLGCVAVDTVDREGFDPLDSGARDARLRLKEVETALEVLKRFAPKKKPLLSPPPQLTESAFWDRDAWQEDLETAQRLCKLQQDMDKASAATVRLENRRLALLPWRSLSLPLELTGTDTVRVICGTLPAALEPDAVRESLAQAADTAELYTVSSDKDLHYLTLLVHKSQQEDALEALRAAGFALPAWKDLTGTAQANLEETNREARLVFGLTQAIRQEILHLADRRGRLEITLDRARQELLREETAQRLRGAGKVAVLKGWLPADRQADLEKLLEHTDCAWWLREPEPEEYPQVPVLLRNNFFTRSMNMVTDMYALPAYGSLDPNPLMAPFFIFFYGFMMADMGYGLLMMAISLVVMKKARPKGPTMRHMIPLMGWCGASTFIMGALTGGFFGDLLPQLAKMLDPDTAFTALPALFSPLDDALAVLIGSLCIGLCQIFTGMGINVYKQVKRGQIMAALCGEVAWFAVFALFGAGVLLGQLKLCLVLIAAVLILTQGYGKQGLVGKAMGILGSLYSNITGYFGDILSYSRLMALMLSGAVIAQVFNTLGGITGNVVTFFLVAMIGNAINFALNLLGCFVHDMRLQCLEFFNRFYEDGGRPFRPLCTDPQNVNIIKE